MFILIIAFLLILITFLTGNYFSNMALDPKMSKRYIQRNIIADINSKQMLESKGWIKEFGTELDIISTDNLRLHGYKVINPIKRTNIWVILVHGYMGCAYELVEISKRFINMGFNVLLIDLRAHGKSEGKYIGMGWKDKDDLIVWINKLCNENKECKIILYGISMGASTVMMASGEELNNNVKVCIEDCGYTSVEDEFKAILKNTNTIIRKYILFSANIVTRIKSGYFFSEASCVKQIRRSNIPTLFIHGEEDTFVPFSMLETIYNSKKGYKEKFTVKNAGHTKCCKIEPKLYWNKVENFIKDHIK